MLRRVSTVSTASVPRRRRRRRCVYHARESLRRHVMLRCLAVPVAKKTLGSNTPVHDWVRDLDVFDGLPLNSRAPHFPEIDTRQVPTSEEWKGMETVCTSSLRLVRAALRRRWSRVDGAVYCRAPTGMTDNQDLAFHLVSNMDLLNVDKDSPTPPQSRALYLTDAPSRSQSYAGDTTACLLQNEMVDIPSHSSALFPLVTEEHEIVGLLLLTIPHLDSAASMTPDDMEIIKETRSLLVSAIKQYRTSQVASIQKQFTKAILQEGKGAVKSVRSYARMLSCRPTAGTLEKDMIEGIEHQGQRISNIVRRLETVLSVGGNVSSPMPSTTLPPSAFLDN